MTAVKHIVASGECEKYSAVRIYSYVYVYKIKALIIIIMVYFLYVMRQCVKGAVHILMHRGISYSHSECKLVSVNKNA